ncbi:MAG: branched-chain amino acid ABC transporter permease [Thaumarchaeota archaeon]|nr:branched-chain amino acid ABC transporter permease [Candidatus Calditenuaceae archaeon]MDW8186688.1 branched-chain amino acid ABC transporter permease [Nitrososphaerota archaeon]
MRPSSGLTSDSLKFYALLALIAVLIVLPFVFTGRYYWRILTQMAYFTVFAGSFALLFGGTNQLFLCVAALAGISAYVSGLLSLHFGLSQWLTIVIGSVMSAGVAAGLSYVSNVRKLGVAFVAILTLSFQLIFENVVTGLVSVTGGDTGFRPPTLSLGPLEATLGLELTNYFIAVSLAILWIVVRYWLLERSRWGLIMKAVKSEELASEVVGINVTRVKVIVASISGFVIGAAGALYGYFNGLVAPIYYSFASIDILSQVMAVFGGLASVMGPVIGSVIFTYINENVRYLGPISLSVYGAVLVILFSVFRNGLVSVLRRWTSLIF